MDAIKDPPVPLIEVSGLRIKIGTPSIEAVKGIDFSIHPGEIIGLAGESGSGKSVTAMSLTRLLPVAARPMYSGCLSLKDMPGNLLELPERRLRRIRGRRIGYIFQEPSTSFNPLFTIESHLKEVLKVNKENPAAIPGAIHAALEEVGIPADKEHLLAYPGAFSGGMLQRAAIACALLAKPDLLVADEPTTALDTTTQKRIMDLLVRLNRDHGMAILMISHDLGVLKEITTRLLVMRQGILVESGPTNEILVAPKHDYTRHLIDTAPKLRL